MTRSAILSVVFICLVISCAEVKKTHYSVPLPNAIPRLNIVNDSTAKELKITMLDIKTVVAGNIATTCFDMRFYNPNDKILEGEFEFPLADGQHISRYALDMGGSLREAVVVEKAKARVAFESTVRRKIDPGLVEKTTGNNYRTRIYPIPAKGYRRILIEAEQVLELKNNQDVLYQLPLYEKEPIDSFAIKVTVIKSHDEPQVEENGTPILDFKKQKDNYVAEHHQTNFIANQTIEFLLRGFEENNDIILTENHDAQTYFYVNTRIDPKYREKKKPATIGLFWDVSSSAEKRDRQKETDLLKKYLSGLSNVSVSFIPFNIYVQPKEDFMIRGNADQLIGRLENIQYDGGTQLGAIDLSKYSFDEVLLFSDGLSTFGKQEMIFSNSPVITITTSPSANYSYLKYIAQQTHGKFIDLGKMEMDESLQELNGQSLQVLDIIYDHSQVSEVVTQTTPLSNSGLSFAGKLKTASADIKVTLGFGNEVIVTKKCTISKKEENDYDEVKRIWATMKISQLDLEYEKNKEEITKLGKEFSVVTQNTSLLVLDRVEDYVEHEIIPPPELQKEYNSLVKEMKERKRDEKENTLAQALAAMKKLKEWWRTDFAARKTTPQTGTPQSTLPAVVDEAATRPTVRISDVIAADGVDSLTIEDSTVALQLIDSATTLEYISNGNAVLDTMRYTTGVQTLNLSASYSYSTASGSGLIGDDVAGLEGRTGEIGPASEIQLNKWKPDATYLKTLEQAAPQERFSKYLSLKKEYSDQPSFFVDVARFFFEKNEKQAGILVLSNICEMKLEAAELLRIVANQLMDAGETALAIETFNQVLKMREEDPQSYRDLALVYNETGEHNKAVELLYKLITGVWDSRFGEVRSIALNEMNAIISGHAGAVNTSGIDQRLISPMPVDVRIVIGWSADNSDIDLWVTDPNKETCSYQHTETVIGGKISRDVTQGYGPEEFLLRKARRGNYIVDVKLFGDSRQTLGGPISIKADLFTDFGKPSQKRETINFRVTTNKEVVTVGSLKFGS